MDRHHHWRAIVVIGSNHKRPLVALAARAAIHGSFISIAARFTTNHSGEL
jgi:hypothetical protein